MSDPQKALSRIAPAPQIPAAVDAASRPIPIDMTGPGLKGDYAGLLEYWQMPRRHKGAVILVTCLGVLVGYITTLSSPRVFQAKTTLEVQGVNQEFLNMKNVNPVADSDGYLDADIQTQVKLIQSRALIASVRQKLESGPKPADLQPPDRLGTWRKALNISPPDSEWLWRDALRTAAKNVRAKSSGSNRIVDVACDSTNAQLAADFCNTLTKEFIDQSLLARWKTTEYTGQWLTKQLDQLKIKLEQQEEDLQNYARSTGLMFTSGKGSIQESQFEDIERELSAARADRIAKQSKYEMASSSPLGALPEVLDDEKLSESQRQLSDLKAKLALLLVTFTPNHVEVRKVQAQITAIEKTLEGSRGNVLTRIRKDFEAAQRREMLLESSYKTQASQLSGKAEAVAHYNLIKQEVDATRALHESLTQRLKEASLASALRASHIRVVDAAEPPERPYKPDVQQRCLVGLLAGFVAGVAFAVFRERADRTLQDPGDIAYYLGLPEFGVLPVAELPEAPRRTPLAVGGVGLVRSRNVDDRIELISWRQKQSLLAESFRTTLTSILFSRQNGSRPRVLVLTSASPKEGKTTVVSNLSIATAEIKQRVLVIDGDMRRPRIHHVFNVGNRRGLSDLLTETSALVPAQVEAVCAETKISRLWVLPSGAARTHASSLLHSERLPELFGIVRERFDMVVIDTPPMVNMADARVLAQLGDALILVVRSGVTTRDAAQLARSRFAEDGTAVAGTILNFWNPKTPGYSYYKYYYDGDQPYSGDDNSDGPDRDPADVAFNPMDGPAPELRWLDRGSTS
jgi:capsular exopolysaccharide synthesis family protein